MVAAVKGLPQEVLDRIDYREWSLRTVEGVARFRQLGAKSLPAVAVEEKLVFECVIPPAEELIAAIERGAHLWTLVKVGRTTSLISSEHSESVGLEYAAK